MVFLLRSYEAAGTGVTSVRGGLTKLHEASVGVNDFLRNFYVRATCGSRVTARFAACWRSLCLTLEPARAFHPSCTGQSPHLRWHTVHRILPSRPSHDNHRRLTLGHFQRSTYPLRTIRQASRIWHCHSSHRLPYRPTNCPDLIVLGITNAILTPLPTLLPNPESVRCPQLLDESLNAPVPTTARKDSR